MTDEERALASEYTDEPWAFGEDARADLLRAMRQEAPESTLIEELRESLWPASPAPPSAS